MSQNNARTQIRIFERTLVPSMLLARGIVASKLILRQLHVAKLVTDTWTNINFTNTPESGSPKSNVMYMLLEHLCSHRKKDKSEQPGYTRRIRYAKDGWVEFTHAELFACVCVCACRQLKKPRIQKNNLNPRGAIPCCFVWNIEMCDRGASPKPLKFKAPVGSYWQHRTQYSAATKNRNKGMDPATKSTTARAVLKKLARQYYQIALKKEWKQPVLFSRNWEEGGAMGCCMRISSLLCLVALSLSRRMDLHLQPDWLHWAAACKLRSIFEESSDANVWRPWRPLSTKALK